MWCKGIVDLFAAQDIFLHSMCYSGVCGRLLDLSLKNYKKKNFEDILLHQYNASGLFKMAGNAQSGPVFNHKLRGILPP